MTKTTRTPGLGGACATSGGTTQSYSYDTADRLSSTGVTYDNFGRITKLPGTLAGGSELVTGYFASNMVATQSQGGVTNSFQLDATGRQRQREQTGGVAGTEIFHYDGPGDSPAWTSLGSTWSRNVTGLGGELAAIQESSGTTTFKLTDLHGDVVASASSSPTATKLLGTYRSDEFGVPQSGTSGRFGWLGGNTRRTELSSGVIQMGARSYVPALGRFLTPDPIPGGSANPYDYANQDPVNTFDLEGTCSGKKKCAIAKVKRLHARAVRAVAHLERLALHTLAHRVGQIAGEVTPRRFGFTVPTPSFVKEIDGMITGSQEFLAESAGLSNNTCDQKAGEVSIFSSALLAAGATFSGGLADAALFAGKALAGLAVGQLAAHRTGVC